MRPQSLSVRSRNLRLIVRTASVFPDSPTAGMINVQLYFVKIMGSAIKEQDVPIDLRSFSSAIMQQTPHPFLYLSFGTMTDAPKHAGLSDFVSDGSCATFIYTVGELSGTVLYAPHGEERAGKQNAWQPMVLSDCLHIRAL